MDVKEELKAMIMNAYKPVNLECDRLLQVIKTMSDEDAERMYRFLKFTESSK